MELRRRRRRRSPRRPYRHPFIACARKRRRVHTGTVICTLRARARPQPRRVVCIMWPAGFCVAWRAVLAASTNNADGRSVGPGMHAYDNVYLLCMLARVSCGKHITVIIIVLQTLSTHTHCCRCAACCRTRTVHNSKSKPHTACTHRVHET